MAVLRDRPYGNFNYLVDLGTGNYDGPEAGFSEVILPEVWIDVIEYRNGNDKENSVRKIPGRDHYGNIILKRGAMGSLDLYSWWSDVRNGNTKAYRTVTIQLQNEDHSAVVLTWKLLRAWPVRYKFSELNAKGNETLIESLELAFERLEME
jgi:phage tail-like protein